MSLYDIQQIQEFLPHRYPFLLIDRVNELDLDAEDGPRIRALKNVTINEDFFNGHFPHHSVMPGVLTLEALAQSAGILGLMMLDKEVAANTLYYFACADNVRFRKPIVPGDQIILESQYKNHRRGIWKFNCRAFVDGNVVCSAEITCAEREMENK